jgi:hypothetical protein
VLIKHGSVRNKTRSGPTVAVLLRVTGRSIHSRIIVRHPPSAIRGPGWAAAIDDESRPMTSGAGECTAGDATFGL